MTGQTRWAQKMDRHHSAIRNVGYLILPLLICANHGVQGDESEVFGKLAAGNAEWGVLHRQVASTASKADSKVQALTWNAYDPVVIVARPGDEMQIASIALGEVVQFGTVPADAVTEGGEALQFLSKQIAANENDYRPRLALAILLRYSKVGSLFPLREMECGRQIEQVLRLEPECILARTERAGLLAQRGHTSEAIKELNQVLTKKPTSAYLFYVRGLTFLQDGNPERARQDFQQSLELAPKSWHFRSSVEEAMAGQ